LAHSYIQTRYQIHGLLQIEHTKVTLTLMSTNITMAHQQP